MIVDLLFSAQTGLGLLLALAFWMFTKIVDKILEHFIERKLFATIRREISWRIRAFKTRWKPLSATFQMSYSPRGDFTVSEIEDRIDDVLSWCEKKSEERIQTGSVRWDNSQTGKVEFQHIDEPEPFDFTIKIKTDNKDLIERPNIPSENRIVSKMSFEIDFEFAYKRLGDTLANLNTVVDFLKASLDEEFTGTVSPGQFVIRPIGGELTLDEWVREEGFEVSMLLADKNEQKTQVEFFPDRAEVRPPYLQMDSEVRRYLKILILEYYLKNQSA